jgi:hypothetical protein
MKTLSLINNEGDNLKLKKLNHNQFQIIDQYNKIISELNLEQFCEKIKVIAWIEGKTSITDSDNVKWVFTRDAGAKPSLFDIITYLTK